MATVDSKIGIFVGRMCPIHIGHMETINRMIEDCGIENCLIILGSVGQKVTFRVLFSYSQRKKWIRKIYGDGIRILGVPDFPNDDDSWFELIHDSIESSFSHARSKGVVFYGGSISDVEYFHSRGYETKIIDRTKMPVSATVIRDMMLRGMDVSDFLDSKIHQNVVENFVKIMQDSEKWEVTR